MRLIDSETYLLVWKFFNKFIFYTTETAECVCNRNLWELEKYQWTAKDFC
jgi:hypothetical protein